MAVEGQVQLLKQSADAWSQWREENPGIRPNLVGADLTGSNLAGRDLRGADLIGANLRRANLRGADCRVADLGEADFSGADLSGAKIVVANLIGASLIRGNLSDANLHGSDLRQANLARADLTRAKLSYADLSLANLSGAELREVDFHHAVMLGTTLGDSDLSTAQGLETVRHCGPSTIGIDTICRSKGKIPAGFLRGAGVPEELIARVTSFAEHGHPYVSCLIRHCAKDQGFVSHLCADLEKAGIRCWAEPEQWKISNVGGLRMNKAFRIHDKILLVLSKDALQKSWISEEIEVALEKERQEKKAIFLPIRLDDAVLRAPLTWAAKIRSNPHMMDFARWSVAEHYKVAFARLLRELTSDSTAESDAGEPRSDGGVPDGAQAVAVSDTAFLSQRNEQ